MLPWVLIPSFPKNISEENIVDVAEVNQQGCLEESGLKILILLEVIKISLLTVFLLLV